MFAIGQRRSSITFPCFVLRGGHSRPPEGGFSPHVARPSRGSSNPHAGRLTSSPWQLVSGNSQPADRYREGEAPRSRTAGIEVQDPIADLLFGLVRMAADHRGESGGYRVEVELSQVVQHVEVRALDPDHFRVGQSFRPQAAIDVAANRGYRGHLCKAAKIPGSPTSPACKIKSQPCKAATASGRRSPWVSEITPIRDAIRYDRQPVERTDCECLPLIPYPPDKHWPGPENQMERGTGLEPVSLAWEARARPIYQPRSDAHCTRPACRRAACIPGVQPQLSLPFSLFYAAHSAATHSWK